jgi:hypothetical protein
LFSRFFVIAGERSDEAIQKVVDFWIASPPYSSTIFYRKERKVFRKGRKVPQERLY